MDALATGLGLSMTSVLWACDGWTIVTLTAGEMKAPSRNVPLSPVLCTIAVIVIYLAANVAYAYVLPRLWMAASPRVAADVVARGLRRRKAKHVIYELIDYRDLDTGFPAMQRTVGFTMSRGAQLIATGKVSKPGVLTPLDVVYDDVLPAPGTARHQG
jgi:amino acid transporter